MKYYFLIIAPAALFLTAAAIWSWCTFGITSSYFF